MDARIKKCSKLFDNHEGIKKKFSDLLQNSFCFRPWNNIYFYNPTSGATEVADVGNPRHRRDTRDNTGLGGDEPASLLTGKIVTAIQSIFHGYSGLSGFGDR